MSWASALAAELGTEKTGSVCAGISNLTGKTRELHIFRVFIRVVLSD